MNVQEKKYKLILAYDGTEYSGWQIQPHSTSIQEITQNAISTILHKPIKLIGSGRTDAGVHAKGQTAHFSVDQELTSRRFLHAANAILPKDIRILDITPVPENFHSQYSATGKVYHYHLWLDSIVNPFKRLYVYQVKHKLDLSLLKEGAQLFLGTHNFSSFANSAHHGSASRDPVRTIIRIDIVEQEGGIRLELEADGFLYKMVRNITGMLLSVGRGYHKITDIPKIIEAKDRKEAASAAPPEGLFLMEVFYSGFNFLTR